MLSQVVIGHLGQILLEVVDHDLGHRLGELLLQLGEHARRRDQHQPVELIATVLGLYLFGDERDEILLGGFVQIAARLDGATRRIWRSPSPWWLSSPRSRERLMHIRGDEAQNRPIGASFVSLTKRALPPSAMDQVRAPWVQLPVSATSSRLADAAT